MEKWQVDLLKIGEDIASVRELFNRILQASEKLGFEYCAYGIQIPTSLTNPKIILLNNYPDEWQARYQSAGYIYIDPRVKRARQTRDPILWTADIFTSTTTTREMWREANEAGICFGWSQSCVTHTGIGGVLAFARSSEEISCKELSAKEEEMRWLVNVSHFSLSRVLVSEVMTKFESKLTTREIEVLKWAADGKTSAEISKILSISETTANFHVKNAIVKLHASNKTAAVVRAAMLGLLN
jgi:LuxR family transcriptional regulator